MASANRTFLIVLGALLCSSACTGNGNSTQGESSESFVMKLIWNCAKTEDINICLKSKAAKLLDKVVKMKEPLPITEYLSLAKDPKAVDSSEQDFNFSETGRQSNSGETENRSEELDRFIWNRLSALFRTRTIQLSVPSSAFTGRDKAGKILKKGHGIFLMAGMMGGMMMKMALAKIALIAGKALIIAKVALVLSLIIALKRLVNNGGGGVATQAEVIYATPEHGHGGRSWKENLMMPSGQEIDGSEMAYHAHRFAAL